MAPLRETLARLERERQRQIVALKASPIAVNSKTGMRSESKAIPRLETETS